MSIRPETARDRGTGSILSGGRAAHRVIRIAMAFMLHKIENIELFPGSIREETVHRILLIREELKGKGQPGQQEQFQMGAIQIQQRQPPTAFAQPGEAEDQRVLTRFREGTRLLTRAAR